MRSDARFSEVARRYGIAERVLFRWKQELTQVAPLFVTVRDRGCNPAHREVHLAFGFIEMRKCIDGLAMLVSCILRQDPFSGHLFVFRRRKANTCRYTAEPDLGPARRPEIDRSTLANWVGGRLEPLQARLAEHVFASPKLFADDTPIPVLDTDRRAERPASHLAKFKGVVQVDGYPGFDRLTGSGDIMLAACWAHARHKFYEVHPATGSPSRLKC